MPKIIKTKLKGVLQIFPDVFKDVRGEFIETYNSKFYKKNLIDIDFVQDDLSISKKNVLRGIHGDDTTWKLISCIHGKIYFVVVDCDKRSKNFGKSQSFILSDKEKQQILIPPKYGNAHLALSEKIIFSYKQSAYYHREGQFSYKWNDPKFKIKWPIKSPILSPRDKHEQ